MLTEPVNRSPESLPLVWIGHYEEGARGTEEGYRANLAPCNARHASLG